MQKLNIDSIEQKLTFSGKVYKIKRVKNLDDLVDQVDEQLFNEDERLPYWAELWPSAIGLSRYIAANSQLLRNKSVLELGCGLGLTSLVLTAGQPAELLITDYEPDCLQMVEDNFVLNGLQAPETQLLDWRRPQLNRHFDCIVASDVLYEERFFEPLLHVFIKYLNKNGIILLAEPGRPIAKSFFRMLQKNNFKFEEFQELVDQDSKEIPVGIYQIFYN